MPQDDLRVQIEDLFSDLTIPEPLVGETDAREAIDDGFPSRSESVSQAAVPFSEPPVASDGAQSPGIVDGQADQTEAEDKASAQPHSRRRLSKPLRRFTHRWQARLSRRLVLAFLAAAIIPSLIISVFGGLSQVSQLRSDAANNLNLLASLQEKRISQWLQSQVSAFTSLAHEPPLVRDMRTYLIGDQSRGERQATQLSIHSRLSSFIVQHPEFHEVFLLDSDGWVTVATDVEHQDQLEKDRPHFVHGRQESYYGPPVHVEKWNTHDLVLAEPVQFITGETIGVLAGFVSTEPLTELMHSAPGLGKSGETYLVNEDGALITALRVTETPASGSSVRSYGIKRAISGQSGHDTYQNYANRRVLGVYKWLPEAQMGLIAEREVTEAFESLFIAVGGILLVALGSVVATAWLGNQMAQRIARPLAQITEAARKMVAGDLQQSVAVDRTDEIGTLARAFNHMAHQLRETIAGLEDTVAERTRQLQTSADQYQKRATHLEVSAGISRAAASILDPQELMQTTVDSICDRFSFYHVSLFLLDETEEWAVVRASTGEVGRQMVGEPHRLRVGGESMVGWACAQRQPRIALDVGADGIHFDNPLLPHTRSELVMPLIVGDNLLGALDVQSTKEAAFDRDDVRTLQGMADLIAIALQNAQLFVETQRIAEHQRLVASFSEHLHQATTAADVLASSLKGLGDAFHLEQATVCVGIDPRLHAAGDGRERANSERKIAPQSGE